MLPGRIRAFLETSVGRFLLYVTLFAGVFAMTFELLRSLQMGRNDMRLSHRSFSLSFLRERECKSHFGNWIMLCGHEPFHNVFICDTALAQFVCKS